MLQANTKKKKKKITHKGSEKYSHLPNLFEFFLYFFFKFFFTNDFQHPQLTSCVASTPPYPQCSLMFSENVIAMFNKELHLKRKKKIFFFVFVFNFIHIDTEIIFPSRFKIRISFDFFSFYILKYLLEWHYDAMQFLGW